MKHCRWQYEVATATSCRCHEVFRKRNMKRSAHPHVAKPRIIAEGCFISEVSSCAAGALHSKNAPLSVDKSAFFVGAGDRTMTRAATYAAWSFVGKTRPPEEFSTRLLLQVLWFYVNPWRQDLILLANCARRSFAALTVHRTVIHYRSYFKSASLSQQQPKLNPF